MKWQILYVNSRAEKKVAERLRSKDLEVFCPMKISVRQWSDRKKKVSEPYFRSYVFVRVPSKRKLEVLETPGVVAFLCWLGKPAVIRDGEMAEVMAFFEKHESGDIVSKNFDPGAHVTVKAGVMKEKAGVVLRQNKNKVVLQIQQLGVALTVEIPKNKVRATG